MAIQRPRTRRRVLAGAGLVVAGTFGGCLAAGGGRSDGTDDGLPERVEVTMTTTPSPKFDPRLVHVAVGGTVVWTLESGSHDTVAYHPDTHGPRRIPRDATPWQSEKLTAVGETFERTFPVPGIYDYVDTEAVCISHEVAGNVGRVLVGWPAADADAQPALRPPQDSLPSVARSTLEDLNERTRDRLHDHPSTPTTDE